MSVMGRQVPARHGGVLKRASTERLAQKAGVAYDNRMHVRLPHGRARAT